MIYNLEDMHNDCVVIRTTFETFDLFPADDPIRDEMQEIVNDARANICRRCRELCASIPGLHVLDRPLDIHEFSKVIKKLLLQGHSRHRLDAFMKVNVFQSVANQKAGENEPDALYRYEPLPPLTVPALCAMSAKQLTVTIFEDLLQSMETGANYVDKHAFDRNVFQKYVAIMFACYATTDPFFYN